MEQQKKEKLQEPSRQIKVRIGMYEYEIKLPNNGQRIDIETLKLKMTESKHGDMLYGGPSAVEAYMLTEAIATFSILCVPQLSNDMAGGSLLNLDIVQSQSLIKAYEKYYNWNKQWREYLNQDLDEQK